MVPAYMTASLLQAKTADASLPRLHIRHRKGRREAGELPLNKVQIVGNQSGRKNTSIIGASYFLSHLNF